VQYCYLFINTSGIARKIDRPEHIEHGSVMEPLCLFCHAEKGERATAGIIYGWLNDKMTNKTLRRTGLRALRELR